MLCCFVLFYSMFYLDEAAPSAVVHDGVCAVKGLEPPGQRVLFHYISLYYVLCVHYYVMLCHLMFYLNEAAPSAVIHEDVCAVKGLEPPGHCVTVGHQEGRPPPPR
jgi:hypothetical protein